MKNKPKMGVLLMTSGWFRDVGLQDSKSDITAEVEKIAAAVVERLSATVDTVYDGILVAEDDAVKAARKIDGENVHGLIVAPLMWCEDQILRGALKQLPKLPILICNFFPYEKLSPFVDFQEMLLGSGTVGTLQMSGFLRREGYRYTSAAGYYEDTELYSEIGDHCRALAVAEKLRGTRCGVLPFRCEQMSTTYVDEFNIRTLYGVELHYLELSVMRNIAQSIDPKRIEDFRALLEEQGYAVEVDERNLTEGIKYSLAMEEIVSSNKLDILVMNDVIEEMHNELGLRPCLTNPAMNAADVVVTMEADIGAGIAMYTLGQYFGCAPFYTELFTVDLQENAFLMGHAGYHNPCHHDPDYGVRIVPDIEYENTDPFTGASTYFKYMPGPVTVVNSVYNGELLQWTVFEGESLPGEPKMNGSCHLFCKAPMPVGRFFSDILPIGVSQHFVVVPGHRAASIERLCAWLNIDFHLLTGDGG
jgi:L-fucose isomerase-like protein